MTESCLQAAIYSQNFDKFETVVNNFFKNNFDKIFEFIISNNLILKVNILF